MFKVNNEDTRMTPMAWKRCEIRLLLTVKTPERRQWFCSGVFIVNFEHISHLALQLGFLYPLKTSESRERFSEVFKGSIKGALGTNGLMENKILFCNFNFFSSIHITPANIHLFKINNKTLEKDVKYDQSQQQLRQQNDVRRRYGILIINFNRISVLVFLWLAWTGKCLLSSLLQVLFSSIG